MTAHIARMLSLEFETGGRLVVHTHYVPAGAPSHPRDHELQRAVCGQYVFPQEKHALEPSCPNCVRLMAEDDVKCEHGVAMDVHCCNCHSGYIFERDHTCEEPR